MNFYNYVHFSNIQFWFLLNEVIVYRVVMYANPLLIVQAMYLTSKGQPVY